MYKSTKTYKGLQGLLLISFLLGVSAVAVADIHYFVQMRVNANETDLVIKTQKGDAGGCSGFSRKKGCVRANVNDDIKVSFLLAGNSKCDATEGGEWRFKDVTLGGLDGSSKPSAWGGFATGDKVDKDFKFLNPATGVLAPETKSDRQLTIRDKNQSEYIVWYKVTAECVDAGDKVYKEITTDPRIENKGTI